MDAFGKLVIAFSLLGVCVLYAISLVVTPPFVPLNEIALHEGTIVRTGGVITDFSSTASGNVLITLVGNQSELLLFVESADKGTELLDLGYGDEIEVEGSVQVYRGTYELVVSGTSIRKVTQGRDIAFVAQIAAHPEEYAGRRIRVVGYVADVHTHVFYLRDEAGSHQMRAALLDDAESSTLQKGDKVIAEGVLSYDAENMRYELKVVALQPASERAA
jgi:DNA/RNA endonuclease YhcR with UshA esterase domain